MEITVKLVIDASPNLEQLIKRLTSVAAPVAAPIEAKAVAPKRQPEMSSAPEPVPAQAVEAEAKPKEISDADMRAVVGPFVLANGPEKIKALLTELGVTTNRTTDLPQEKRQEFIDKIKALM